MVKNAQQPCVETATRYSELVTVCRTQTKPRSDVGGRGEMVVKVSRCLTMKTAVHHDLSKLLHIGGGELSLFGGTAG